MNSCQCFCTAKLFIRKFKMYFRLILQNGCYFSCGQCIISKQNVHRVQSSGLYGSFILYNFYLYRMSVRFHNNNSQIGKFMGTTWGPPGSCRPQIGPMLAPWTLLSGKAASTVMAITWTFKSPRLLNEMQTPLCISLQLFGRLRDVATTGRDF